MENKIKLYYAKEEYENPEIKLQEHIFYLENRDEIDEDAYQCKWCTDHCYLSYVTCSEHTLNSESVLPSGDSTDEKSPVKQVQIQQTKYERRKLALNA